MSNEQVKEIDCFLEFQLNGLREVLIYRVRPEAWRRLQAVLEHEKENEDIYNFFSFNTRDGLTVSVSIQNIQSVHYTLAKDAGYSDRKDFDNKISIYYTDRLEPVTMIVSEDDDAFNLAASVLGTPTDEPFLSFMDGGGNAYTFSLEYVVAMELSTSQVEAGKIATD